MKRMFILLVCAASVLGLCACAAGAPQTGDGSDYIEKELHLCVGDTYDFAAMGYMLENLDGTAVFAVGDVITAAMVGTDRVTVTDTMKEAYRFTVTVYEDAAALGDKFPIDKGMFQGKKVIAFGDSITDGCLLDPTRENGLNYDDTYFAQLCRYLGAASDPTDLENCNFACGGTTLTYGLNGGYGISGVERISKGEAFTDGGRIRNPYPNTLDADLCVIFYGANDLTAGAKAQSDGSDGLNDKPQTMQEAKTVRGGMYYMITQLRKMNPKLKILVLPPLYRRADGTLLRYSDENRDVVNLQTDQSLRQFGQVIGQVCEEQGARFIDWYGLFDYESFGRNDAAAYSYDGLHPNVEGHKKMFVFLQEQLEAAQEES